MHRIFAIGLCCICLSGCNLFEPALTPDAGSALADVAPSEDMRTTDLGRDHGVDLTDTSVDMRPDLPVDLGSPADVGSSDVGADLADAADAAVFELPEAIQAYDFEAVVNGRVPDIGASGLYPLLILDGVVVADGMATFSGGALEAIQPPDAFYDAVEISTEAAISLWLETPELAQGDPLDESTSKRLITFSQDSGVRNLTIAHVGTDIMVRVTTTLTTPNGTPSLRIPNVMSAGLHHHMMQLDGGNVEYYVDGQLVFVGGPGGDVVWSTFGMRLGDEFFASRSWVGDLHDVRLWANTFDVATIQQIYNLGPKP